MPKYDALARRYPIGTRVAVRATARIVSDWDEPLSRTFHKVKTTPLEAWVGGARQPSTVAGTVVGCDYLRLGWIEPGHVQEGTWDIPPEDIPPQWVCTDTVLVLVVATSYCRRIKALPEDAEIIDHDPAALRATDNGR